MDLPKSSDSLPRSFYEQSTPDVARQLISKAILHRVANVWIGGIITETEAYLAEDDPASHSSRGETKSNASMFAQAGTLYVYPIHAKHCLNAVTESAGQGAAVLIRAIEPIWGIEQMRQHRGFDDLRRLTRGPAMLCQALVVDRSHDGIDIVLNKNFRIADCDSATPEIEATTRIGISKAMDLPLRFIDTNSRFLSR